MTTTPVASYQPGDRVIARKTTYISSQLYSLAATVVAPTLQGGYDDETFFKFDNDPPDLAPTQTGARHWRTADIPVMFYRQPIEAGCFVREVPGSNVFGNSRPIEVFEVDGTKARVKGFLGTFWTDVAKLIRVAPPEPNTVSIGNGGMRINLPDGSFIAVGVDLASGPDQTVFTRIVNDPAHLKQAQDLARVIHAKHFAHTNREFKVADNLPHILDQIDNMTAGMIHNRIEVETAEYLDQITEFAAWIAANMKVPVGTDDVFDVARNLLSQQKRAIADAAQMFAPDGSIPTMKVEAWLKLNAPQPEPFKRGDLVRGGIHHYNARIVTLDIDPERHEIMYVQGPFQGHTDKVPLDKLRHVDN